MRVQVLSASIGFERRCQLASATRDLNSCNSASMASTGGASQFVRERRCDLIKR